ncbi:class I SAM-dependent methyltransferase [Pollutibacter soli]|uniref:class I SAM-dependent methyltransferase n=1 Tax=Pollutibacter soli TaxID=3034157 RepID=UPI00301346B4
MKDLFSTRSDLYAKFRPTYPEALFHFLASKANAVGRLWDCATGNGQVAGPMSLVFAEVYATDISSSQISNAVQAPNIFYSIQPAEKVDFPGDYFDMITVSQAIHWFNFDAFYHEVARTLKPGGVFAAIGYGMFNVMDDEKTDRETQAFYHDVTGPYWDSERKYVDGHYQNIPFPFLELETPEFSIDKKWTRADLLGYLSTWSAVKNYIRINKKDPIVDLEAQLLRSWPADQEKQIRFPVFMRMGKLRDKSL